MEALNERMNVSDSFIIKIWNKLPLLIRTILIGVFVCEIGIIVWLFTIGFIPVPWSFFIMIGVFWLYLRFFSGKGRPHKTVKTRKLSFRSTRMTTDVWKWGLLAALLLVIIIQSALIITFRLIDFPQDIFTLGINYNDYPLWFVIIFIIMAALEAGIFEEVGYRGYMQVPLERRYGSKIGIVIVSIMFVVLHLHQVWAPPVLIHIFVFSVLWGVLAYTSGSLIPGIISHTIVDIFSFSFWWSGLAEEFVMRTIFEVGVDFSFIFWAIIFTFSLLGFFFTIYKLILIQKANLKRISSTTDLDTILRLGNAYS